MATKYILLDKKTNKPIDKRPYSIEQLKEKVYAIKKEQNLSDDQMNATFGYLEIDDGSEPAEQNSSGSAQTSENEFKSAESNDDKYGFSTNNYISSANLFCNLLNIIYPIIVTTIPITKTTPKSAISGFV